MKLFFICMFTCLLPWQAVYASGHGKDSTFKKIFQFFTGNPDKRNFFIFSPSVSYSPETRLAVGLFGVYNFHTSKDTVTQTSNVQTTMAYTQNRQFFATPSWQVFFKNDDVFWGGTSLLQKFSEYYFGIGNQSKFEEAELYQHNLIQVQTRLQKRVYKRLFLGPIYTFHYMFGVTPGAQTKLFKNDFAGSTGARASGGGVAATIDSRDYLLGPTKGMFADATLQFFESWTGSTHTFNIATVDFRKYFMLKDKHILAAQIYTAGSHGSVPFRMLPRIGDKNLMRGYYEGRFRDKYYAATQLEYRFPIIWRIGGAVFGGAGEVAPNISAFRLKDFHPNYGGGLRFLLNERSNINLRLDVGFGPGNSGFYAALGEAF